MKAVAIGGSNKQSSLFILKDTTPNYHGQNFLTNPALLQDSS